MTTSKNKPWRQVLLGSLGEFKNGVNFGKEKKGKGIRLINVKDIFEGDGRIHFESLDRVALADKKGIEGYYVKVGDLFFVRSSVKRDGVGLVGMAQRSDKQTVHCGFVIRLRLTTLDVDPLFLTYQLRSPHYRQVIIGLSSGAAITNISQDVLGSLPVTLPPLATQHKAASILSAYDDLIENNHSRIRILEEMSRAIYHEWFVKFRFPGHKKVRMVDSPLGKIPAGWGVRKLSELSQLTKEKFREDKHSDLPLLDMARMLQHTLLVGEMGCPEELSTSRILFNEDDILFGSIRPYLHKVALAPCQGVTNVSVLVIRPIAEVYKSLLSVLLSSVDTVRWADQHSTGTKMPVIKWDILQTMPVSLPDESILGRFHDIVYPMLQTIKMTCSRNRNLCRTRAMLLPKLISGELDVEDLDIDTEVLAQ